MTKMVLESEQYKKIASKEHIYAIEQGVSRFNVADPSSVFTARFMLKLINKAIYLRVRIKLVRTLILEVGRTQDTAIKNLYYL